MRSVYCSLEETGEELRAARGVGRGREHVSDGVLPCHGAAEAEDAEEGFALTSSSSVTSFFAFIVHVIDFYFSRHLRGRGVELSISRQLQAVGREHRM